MGSCEVSVAFAPNASGVLAANLLMKFAGDKVVNIPLIGMGTSRTPLPSAAGQGTVKNPAGGTNNYNFLLMQQPGGGVIGNQLYYVFQLNGQNYLFRATNVSPNGLVINAPSAVIIGAGTLTKLASPGSPSVNLPGTYTYRVIAGDGSPDTFGVTIFAPDSSIFHQIGTPAAGLPINGGSILNANQQTKLQVSQKPLCSEGDSQEQCY